MVRGTAIKPRVPSTYSGSGSTSLPNEEVEVENQNVLEMHESSDESGDTAKLASDRHGFDTMLDAFGRRVLVIEGNT